MSEQLKRGERIPGSRYFREYCDCGEALRVTEHWVGHNPCCEKCSGKANRVGNPKTVQDDDAWRKASGESMSASF